MGLKPASGEVAAACVKTFGDLPFVHTIHDDVVVAAPNKTQHYQALTQFLTRVKETWNP